jgi:hypothetical protein
VEFRRKELMMAALMTVNGTNVEPGASVMLFRTRVLGGVPWQKCRPDPGS